MTNQARPAPYRITELPSAGCRIVLTNECDAHLHRGIATTVVIENTEDGYLVTENSQSGFGGQRYHARRTVDEKLALSMMKSAPGNGWVYTAAGSIVDRVKEARDASDEKQVYAAERLIRKAARAGDWKAFGFQMVEIMAFDFKYDGFEADRTELLKDLADLIERVAAKS
jgi:hypothetical protein